MTKWTRYGVLTGWLLGALLVWTVGSVSKAAAVDRTYPRVDDRVWIAAIAEDQVQVSAPYLFHEGKYRADLHTLAEWACQLYKRTAVPLSNWPSNEVCDGLGATAAKRDPGCWHTHLYACAIP